MSLMLLYLRHYFIPTNVDIVWFWKFASCQPLWIGDGMDVRCTCWYSKWPRNPYDMNPIPQRWISDGSHFGMRSYQNFRDMYVRILTYQYYTRWWSFLWCTEWKFYEYSEINFSECNLKIYWEKLIRNTDQTAESRMNHFREIIRSESKYSSRTEINNESGFPKKLMNR